MTGCTTDLLRAGLAQWKHPGGKHILSSVVDGTRRENVRSYFGLQPGDQIHVESQRKNPLRGQDDCWVSRPVNGDHEIK